MPVHYVYTVTHISTGMFYIGCTDDIERRKREHYKTLNNGSHRNPQMQQHFTHVNDYTWSTIEVGSREEALALELQNIRASAHNPLLMNTVGLPYTEGRRKAKSEEWDTSMKSEASKRALAFWTDGRKAVQATVARQQKLGTVHSEETKEKIGLAKKGIPKSDAHKQRLSVACGKSVTIDGVFYTSCSLAGKSLGVTQATVGNRCRNPNFPNWQFN